MSKADEALQSVQQSNESFKLKKEPAKHLKEGNYQRADYFEARCKELELEVMDLQRKNRVLEAELALANTPKAPASDEAPEDIVSKFKSSL